MIKCIAQVHVLADHMMSRISQNSLFCDAFQCGRFEDSTVDLEKAEADAKVVLNLKWFINLQK